MEVLTLDFFKIICKNYLIGWLLLLILHDICVYILKNNQYVYMFPLIPFGFINSMLTPNWIFKLINPFYWLLLVVPFTVINDLFKMFGINYKIQFKVFSFKNRNGIKELKKFNKNMKENKF